MLAHIRNIFCGSLFWIPSRSFIVTWQKGSSPFGNSGLLTLQQNMKVPALPLGGLHGPIPKRSLGLDVNLACGKWDDIILPHLLRNTNLYYLNLQYIMNVFAIIFECRASTSNTSFYILYICRSFPISTSFTAGVQGTKRFHLPLQDYHARRRVKNAQVC